MHSHGKSPVRQMSETNVHNNKGETYSSELGLVVIDDRKEELN